MKYILYALPTALLLAFACALSRRPAPRLLTRSERATSLAGIHRQIHILNATAADIEAARSPALPRGLGQ